jgi:hypothetical protein
VSSRLLGFVKVTQDFSARRAVEASLVRVQDAEKSQRIAEPGRHACVHASRRPSRRGISNLEQTWRHSRSTW